MKKPGIPGCWRFSILAIPGIQANMVMVTSRGKKCRIFSHSHHDFKAQQVTIEFKRLFDIGDFQVHMANLGLSGNSIFFPFLA